METVMWILLSLIVITSTILCLFHRFIKHNKEAENQYNQFLNDIAEFEHDINQLSNDEARSRLLPLLDNPENYYIKQDSIVQENELKFLPPGVREIIEKYHYIETMWGNYDIGGDNVEKWNIDNSFYKIGTGIEFNDIVIKDGDENIY